jgi:hypothetical protein
MQPRWQPSGRVLAGGWPTGGRGEGVEWDGELQPQRGRAARKLFLFYAYELLPS